MTSRTSSKKSGVPFESSEKLPDGLDFWHAFVTMVSLAMMNIEDESSSVEKEVLPFLDELKDKLETTLIWREMSGSQLSSHLDASLNKLVLSIHETLITDGMQPVADQIDALSSHIDRDNIMNATDTLIGGLISLSQKVTAGDLSGASADTTALNSSLAQLRSSLTVIETNLL